MAAYEEALQTITLEAGADLSGKQYLFVSVAADGQVDPSGDGVDADGVLQNKPAAAGSAATIAIAGVTKVEAGATFTAGDDIASNAAGEAIEAATGDTILARALVSATDGDIVPILLKLGNKAPLA